VPDFTLKTYKSLLQLLRKCKFEFQPFADFLRSPSHRVIVLRHDVDRLPANALQTAQIEYSLGIRGSYYFRIVPESFDEKIIKEIAALGHEVGYHYEDVDLAVKKLKNQDSRTRNQEPGTRNQELFETAIFLFREHLRKLQQIVQVETICMHGSPRSEVDNKSLWEKYDYRDFGITGEPYFDVDFTKVLYLTDTGRRWDGRKVSVRDKVSEEPRVKNQEPRQEPRDKTVDEAGEKLHAEKRKSERTILSLDPKYRFRSTSDIIRAAEQGRLPDQIMLTIHPQRWTDEPVAWMKELVWQNIKNQVKRVLIKTI